MVVGISYNDDGTRFIDRVLWDSNWTHEKKEEIADKLSNYCDEVYILDTGIEDLEQLDLNNIIFEGCRMY